MSESPVVYSTSTPKAKLKHTCCECRGEIQPGEKYHLFAGLWDDWGSFKTCVDCETLRNDVTATIKDSEEYPPFGHLYEDVFESRHSAQEWVKIFMNTRRKRNAPESHRRWMEIAEEEMLNTKDQASEGLAPADC